VPVGGGPIDRYALHSQWLLQVSSASWSGNFYSKGVTISELVWVVPAFRIRVFRAACAACRTVANGMVLAIFRVAHVQECTSPISVGREWRFSDWGA
jgi:hypothetical protein